MDAPKPIAPIAPHSTLSSLIIVISLAGCNSGSEVREDFLRLTLDTLPSSGECKSSTRVQPRCCASGTAEAAPEPTAERMALQVKLLPRSSLCGPLRTRQRVLRLYELPDLPARVLGIEIVTLFDGADLFGEIRVFDGIA